MSAHNLRFHSYTRLWHKANSVAWVDILLIFPEFIATFANKPVLSVIDQLTFDFYSPRCQRKSTEFEVN